MQFFLQLCDYLMDILWSFNGNNKNIEWNLDMDSACDAFSLSMNAILALSRCLLVYLNVAL